ncbi:MAG: hypothetical protein RLZZ384_1294 [Pseudomonadota bacterium]|jgi:hypothetical protein
MFSSALIFNTPSDTLQVSAAIRDAVAPVFLLTGIGSLLGVVVNRLGRTIDRARYLNGLNTEQRKKFLNEFNIIQKRVTWMRWSIGLFIVAGLCISLSVALIFIGVAIKLNVSNFILGTFIFAMFALILGIFCFLREIIYATQEVITWNRQD